MHTFRLKFLTPALLALACDLPPEGEPQPGGDDAAGDDGAVDGEAPADDGEGEDDDADEPSDDDAGEPSDDDDGADDEGELPTEARVRVVHASPDAPAVDVYVAGSSEPVITDLAYGGASAFLSVPAGQYSFEIRAAGAAADSDPVYTTDSLSLTAGTDFTAIAAGLLGGQAPDEAFRVLALAQGFEAGEPGTAAVRIVHASPDAPTVDLDVGDDGSTELTGLARFADTGEAGVPLPAGAPLQIGIVAAQARVTAFTTPELPDGGELIVIATGLLSDLPRQSSGFSLLAIGPDGSIGFIQQNPTLYALHAGPDAPAVDVCSDGQPLLQGVSFGDLGPIQVPPGEYTIDVFAAPSDCQGAPAYSQDTGALAAGQRILAIATGELSPEASDPGFRLQPYPEEFSLDYPDQGIFSIIHAASAPAVDIGIVVNGVIPADGRLATDVSFTDQTGQFRAEPGNYRIGIALAGGHPPLHPLAKFDVPIDAGFRGFVVAAGSLEQGEASFRLFAIPTQASWAAIPLAPQ